MKHLKINLMFYVVNIFVFVVYDFIYTNVYFNVVLSFPVFIIFVFLYVKVCESFVFEYVREVHPEFLKKYPPDRDYFNISQSFSYLNITHEDINKIEDASIRTKIYYLKHVIPLVIGGFLVLLVLGIIIFSQ